MELIGTYKYIHGKNICNERELRDIEEGSAAYDGILGRIKSEDLFHDIPCVVDYVNKKLEEKRNLEKRKHNLVNAIPDDNWGEVIDFSVEEMLDMPVMSEVQMNLTNTDCVGQDALCKVVSNPIGVESKTVECKELDYIETNNFTPKDSETHDNSNHGIFCVTEKDLDLINIDDLY